jgi:ABC-2 type transport system permease protein
MFLCFFFYTAFAEISQMGLSGPISIAIEWLGIDYHYQSISRGIIDTRDLVYFLTFIAIFLGATRLVFGKRKW